MMNLTVMGVGAAGNKAVIDAIEKKVVSVSNVKLLNTTTKDIPDKYKMNTLDIVIKFSSMLGGCGKEPNKGRKSIFEAIKNGEIDFTKFITEDTKAVVLVTSIEGGTGCGATPVIAQYLDQLGLPVHVFAFIGFQDELRGVNNSLKFFSSLPDNVILHTIENSKFLDYTKNYSKAEKLANDEFARQLKIMIGSKMIPGDQNIDDTDHYKLITTTGYCDIRHINLNEVKNVESANKVIADNFDTVSCLEYDPGCSRLGIIINAPRKIRECIDSKLEVIKRYTGEPLEIYRHLQDNTEEDDAYMDIIISGLSYPELSIKNIGKKYNDMKAKMPSTKKSISDILGDIDIDDDNDDIIEEETHIKTINKNPEQVLKNFDIAPRSYIRRGSSIDEY